ncbi:MAG TPA: RHS repeat-associated core domain-containing protein, partial [Niabella sp.]|nr:RHS repeat-associated core domain-containing protein [Niabella sp.]
YSDAKVETSLGYNWHHSYNIGLYDVGNGFAIRLKDGREAALPYLQKGEVFYHRIEQLFFERDDKGYFVTDANKLVYRFTDKKNREGFAMITSISNPQGFDIRFEYDAKGSLSSIIDSSGRLIRVQCDELGRVLRVYTIADNRRINFIRYTYDAAGNMVSNEDVLGAVKRFEYDGHLLVKLTNQSGHSFYWEYEGKGDEARCIHTWGDGGVLEYWTEYKQHDDGSGITIARDSLGHETEYFYDSKKLIYKIIDANGGVTRQIYNQYQELEVVVNPEGGTVQYQYNGYGKLIRSINENDEASTYLYDDRLNLVFAGSPGGKTLSWEYDQQNRLVSKSGIAGNTVNYSYSGKYLKYITDNKNRRFELTYDERHDLARFQYPNGTEQLWDYDELGNTIFHKDVRGNITTYEYNDGGLVTRINEPDGNTHHFEYDAARNMIEARDYSHLVQFEYGPLGVLRGRKQNDRSVRFNYDTELQLRSIVNEGGEVYKFGLDALGNVVNEWGFDGLNRRYQRNGNGQVTKVLRPGEKWTGYDYDSVGNIIKEEHSDGSMAAYKYDADAMLIEAINETSHVKLLRDKTGRVIEEEQDGYKLYKTYDSEGNCIRTASSLGADISMQYDEWGMLIEMNGKCDRRSGGQPSPPSLLDAKLKEIDARIAKLTGTVGSSSTYEVSNATDWQALFQRDNSGLELHRQLSGGISIATERDGLGRVIRRTIGAKNIEQSRIRYDWRTGNKLNKIVNELTRAQADFEYDSFDNLISATYEEKTRTETVYRIPDKIGNLFKTKDRSDRKYSKGGCLLEDDKYCYYYDAEGNLVFKEFKRNENGSAVDKTEIAKEKGIVLRRTATGWEYEWAANGMLQKVINPGGREIAFYYDPLGRRTAKIVRQHHSDAVIAGEESPIAAQNAVTRWLWDGNVPLHEWNYTGQYPPKKAVNEKGIIEEEEPVEDVITWVFEEGSFVPCAKLEGEEQYSIITDYLGTPTHAYNKEGKMVWERELDIYGATRQQKGKNGFVPYLYQGQYVDEETGLVYNRYRYYDLERGLYLGQDPIGLGGGRVLYGYV